MLAVVEHFTELTQDLLDRLDIARIAVYQQFIAACPDTDVEQRFEIFDVLILYTKQSVQALGWKFEFLKIAQIMWSS